eukprot:scaffold15702_cov66-Phaeocystis_antarctica.AAC.3
MEPGAWRLKPVPTPSYSFAPTDGAPSVGPSCPSRCRSHTAPPAPLIVTPANTIAARCTRSTLCAPWRC